MRNQFAALQRWQADYGPVFRVDLGPASFVLATNGSVAAEMLIDRGQEITRDGNLYDSMKAVFGEVSMVTSDGPAWRTRRRLAQPHFRRTALAATTQRIATTVGSKAVTLEPGQRNVIDFCGRLALEVGLSILFGQSLNESQTGPLMNAIDFAVSRIGVGWASHRLPRWLPIPGRRRFLRELGVVDGVLHQLIHTRLASGDYKDDMLGALLQMADQGSFSPEEIRNETVALLIAGYETTSTAMAWALHELAHNPEMQARIRAEAEALDEDGSSALEQLPFTHRVFQEALRKYTSVLWIPRNANQDTQLGGYAVPAGTPVLCSPYLVHHEPTAWPDPERFDPERFADDSEPLRRFSFMPFGLGQHMCIGQHLARLEGTLALARIAQHWRLSPIPGREPIQRISTTLTAKDGVWLDFQAL